MAVRAFSKNRLTQFHCQHSECEERKMLSEADLHISADGTLEEYTGEVFLDVKQLLGFSTYSDAEVQAGAEALIDNYADVADGIRLPMFFDGHNGIGSIVDRSDVTLEVASHAIENGLEIYLSPIGAGTLLPDEAKGDAAVYAEQVISDLQAYWEAAIPVEYVSPFNEPGLTATFMNDVMNEIKGNLNGAFAPADWVGPDYQLLTTTYSALSNWDTDTANLFNQFDIISSHNLEPGDGSAGNEDMWRWVRNLVDTRFGDFSSFGDPAPDLWDSEALENTGDNARVSIAADSLVVDGIVLYEQSRNPSDYTTVTANSVNSNLDTDTDTDTDDEVTDDDLLTDDSLVSDEEFPAELVSLDLSDESLAQADEDFDALIEEEEAELATV